MKNIGFPNSSSFWASSSCLSPTLFLSPSHTHSSSCQCLYLALRQRVYNCLICVRTECVYMVVPLCHGRARGRAFPSTGAIMKVRYSQTGWAFRKPLKNRVKRFEWSGVTRVTRWNSSAHCAESSFRVNNVSTERSVRKKFLKKKELKKENQEHFLTVSAGIGFRMCACVYTSVCVWVSSTLWIQLTALRFHFRFRLHSL